MAKQQEDKFGDIEVVLTRSEQFIENNQKKLLNGLIVVLIIVAAIFGYKKYILEPRGEEAASQLFGAQNYFEKDSLHLALNGDGNISGFIDIADKYSSTAVGNLANYYAGICYLYIGEYENAITYLEKFSSDDFLVVNLAKSNIGDAYMQLENYAKAAEYYKKAASSNKNDFSTPLFLMKGALASEKSDNYQAALELYEKIKRDFPNSSEARDVEKYIMRAEIILKK
ncbi:hypothetical protein FACS1894199_04250 [Bacteroidia bacterium]|nr:hypothetical protein FACS1894199_04250 [Bacteroidia bacterium]